MAAKSMFSVAALAALLSTAPAAAFVEVGFEDGNPWDYFVITTADCPVKDAILVVDLRPSVAGVLIYTEYGGDGTQDPLPAELFEGQATLVPVSDGDRTLTVLIAALDKETPITLRMDVDDTSTVVPEARISVAKSEISGATVALTFQDETTTGTFDANGVASLPLPVSVDSCQLLF